MLTLEYEGHPVRLFEDVDGDGRVWFVSRDVAMASGYKSAAELVRVVTSAGVFWMLHKTKWEATPGLLHWLEREVLNVSLKPGAWVQSEVVREG